MQSSAIYDNVYPSLTYAFYIKDITTLSFFLRGHLSYLLIKWLLTTIKFCIEDSMLNVQSLIHPKPNSRKSPI